ncbi:MAG: electron transfer flavoprotein subunit alpha/FixB family protein [bacterium]
MVLVSAEQREGTLKKVTFEALLAGFKLAERRGEELAAAVLGSGIAGLAEGLRRFGAARVFVVDDPSLERYTPDGYCTALAGLVAEHKPGAVVMSATTLGKDLSSTLAARLETTLVPDVTAIEFADDGQPLFTRPVYAGKVLSQIRASAAGPLVISVRPRAVAPISETDKDGTVVAAQLGPAELRSKVAEVVKAVTKTVELTEADIIISGGRGMKGPENYAILEDLAATVNAAVGASRAAVDAGWRDHQFQVGQTGKTVAPQLYIACGISGAIQHLVGMSSSKCIVAVNKDPEANIMKVADYAIVGDLFTVVPLLTEAFRKLKAQS